MSFYKTGVVTTGEFLESSGTNLVQADQINKSFSYTPSTGTNSCLTGYTVDYSDCEAGEKLHIRIKVEWSGFDTSNTAGTFAMWFQGATYNVANAAWEWAGNNMVPPALNSAQDLKTLVLSASSGTKVIETTATVGSHYPGTRTKEHVGIRTDYSNGTGKITISELEVIKDKYYASSDTSELRIAENYIAAERFYEY